VFVRVPHPMTAAAAPSTIRDAINTTAPAAAARRPDRRGW
jgi:hypothetical protein